MRKALTCSASLKVFSLQLSTDYLIFLIFFLSGLITWQQSTVVGMEIIDKLSIYTLNCQKIEIKRRFRSVSERFTKLLTVKRLLSCIFFGLDLYSLTQFWLKKRPYYFNHLRLMLACQICGTLHSCQNTTSLFCHYSGWRDAFVLQGCWIIDASVSSLNEIFGVNSSLTSQRLPEARQ